MDCGPETFVDETRRTVADNAVQAKRGCRQFRRSIHMVEAEKY